MKSSLANDASAFLVTSDWISTNMFVTFERIVKMLEMKELVIAAICEWKKDEDN
ncbi:hypothetical protein SLEP1_g19273 [Rubroshorea leprosula]|nr:hypothetical protein SLEP1_g19273 [Rubroshorea leprosula]